MKSFPSALVSVGVAICMIGTALFPGVLGASVPTGSIAGTVTSAVGGAAIAGVEVVAYDASTQSVVTETFTDSSGKFTFASVAVGSYKIGFDTTSSGGGNFVAQYFNGEPSFAAADSVVVSSGTTTSGIGAVMQPGGRISGTVTGAATGSAIPGALVVAYDATTGALRARATTSASGAYSITQLPAASYKVGFSDYFYRSQYYLGERSLATANPVAVGAGGTATGIDAAMQKKPVGHISGTVTDVTTHAALSGTFVAILDATTKSYVTSTSTGHVGTYSVAVPAGSYDVSFFKATYLGQYYNGQSTLATANPVSVTAKVTTSGIDAALQLGGKITGKVTDQATHSPMPGATVAIFDASTNNAINEVFTDSKGRWSLAGLTAGTYKMCAAALGTDYAPACFRSGSSVATATPIPVQVGTTVTNINAALRHGAKISGVVTSAGTGTPLAGITVTVYDATGSAVGGGTTDGSGAYLVEGGSGAVGLPTGSYRVEFSGTGHITQYYDNQPTLAAATPVHAVEGSTSTDINAALQ